MHSPTFDTSRNPLVGVYVALTLFWLPLAAALTKGETRAVLAGLAATGLVGVMRIGTRRTPPNRPPVLPLRSHPAAYAAPARRRVA